MTTGHDQGDLHVLREFVLRRSAAEERYHFPDTYLRAAQGAVNDWVVYYEPRRTSGPQSSTGRQACFATARVTRLGQDQQRPGHHFAYLRDFVEFDRAVPFREGEHYYEGATLIRFGFCGGASMRRRNGTWVLCFEV